MAIAATSSETCWCSASQCRANVMSTIVLRRGNDQSDPSQFNILETLPGCRRSRRLSIPRASALKAQLSNRFEVMGMTAVFMFPELCRKPYPLTVAAYQSWFGSMAAGQLNLVSQINLFRTITITEPGTRGAMRLPTMETDLCANLQMGLLSL
jgi:hypothetical protein